MSIHVIKTVKYISMGENKSLFNLLMTLVIMQTA